MSEVKTLESQPANVAVTASGIPTDSIDKAQIRAHVEKAAIIENKSAYGKMLGNNAQLDYTKLVAKTCFEIKSRMGLGMVRLPDNVHADVCEVVRDFVTEYFHKNIRAHDGQKGSKTVQFRKSHETAPVRIKHTMVAYEAIGFKHQRLLLNIRRRDAENSLNAAYGKSNDDGIRKWTKAIEACDEMLSNLSTAEACLAMKEA